MRFPVKSGGGPDVNPEWRTSPWRTDDFTGTSRGIPDHPGRHLQSPNPETIHRQTTPPEEGFP